MPLGEVDHRGFAAVFLPGGHGTMFDLPASQELARTIVSFYESGRIVAAVCHGPAGLLGATLSGGAPLVRGKRVTGFTNEEERATGLDTLMPFLLEDRLRELGAVFSRRRCGRTTSSRTGGSSRVKTRSPASSAAKAVIQALAETGE